MRLANMELTNGREFRALTQAEPSATVSLSRVMAWIVPMAECASSRVLCPHMRGSISLGLAIGRLLRLMSSKCLSMRTMSTMLSTMSTVLSPGKTRHRLTAPLPTDDAGWATSRALPTRPLSRKMTTIIPTPDTILSVRIPDTALSMPQTGTRRRMVMTRHRSNRTDLRIMSDLPVVAFVVIVIIRIQKMLPSMLSRSPTARPSLSWLV